MTYYERNNMSRNSKVVATILALTIFSSAPASAWWSISLHARERLIHDGELHVNANSYFTISTDELTKQIDVGDKVAVINSGGVIDKIITVTESTDLSNVYAAEIPESGGVAYVDKDGVVRLDAINQGDIVSVATPNGEVTLNDKVDLTQPSGDNPNPEPTSTPIPDSNSSTITAVTVSQNNSTSITVTPPAAEEGTSVSVQVVTDGRSHTSVGTDNAGTPVTITDVPANSNVTVQTTVVDNATGATTVIQNPVVTTPEAPVTPPAPARDETVDRATIAQPTVASQNEGSNGHRSANIAVPEIPNFNPATTNVQLVIRDKTGATTAMGLGGEGGVITVDWLSPTESYEITVVIRDLGTGRETSIAGNRLP
jgi:hypothetical protein